MHAALAEGFQGQLVKVSWHDTASSDEVAQERANFAIAESQVLLPHAVETLFRLCLAHREQPKCPWLEVARLMNPRAFKAAVEPYAGFVTPEESARISDVFLGAPAFTSDLTGTDDWQTI